MVPKELGQVKKQKKIKKIPWSQLYRIPPFVIDIDSFCLFKKYKILSKVILKQSGCKLPQNSHASSKFAIPILSFKQKLSHFLPKPIINDGPCGAASQISFLESQAKKSNFLILGLMCLFFRFFEQNKKDLTK